MDNMGVDLALGLGDYAYLNGSDAVNNWWENYMTPLKGKFKGALGDHDTQDSLIYLSKFKQPNWVIAFDYQNVHFISLSTERSSQPGTLQYNSIKNDLAEASSNPTIKWIVVFFHKPMYTSPSVHKARPGLISTYQPLFDQYGVDLVLQGHNHNYQRSYPIMYNSSDPLDPIITTTSKTNYVDPPGQLYLVVGTGGVSSYSFLGHAPYMVKQFTSKFGFLNIDIINEGRTLEGTFYANDGSIKDQFSITKCSC
jgi:hypothetical protein